MRPNKKVKYKWYLNRFELTRLIRNKTNRLLKTCARTRAFFDALSKPRP